MLKIKKENFINLLYPFNFKCNKILITNFLSEIYSNYYKRCDKIFDRFSFQELLDLPMIVCNKIYSAFTLYQDRNMALDEFSTNIYTLFFGDIEDKMSMAFDIFDFDGDGSIIYEDVFLILSHMHLIDYKTDTIEYLENIILSFFDKKNKIDKENFFNLKENFDILLLLLIYLNKYQSLINERDLSFYNYSIQTTKYRNKIGREFTNYHSIFSLHTFTFNDYEELEYKPSDLLLEYLSIISFEKKNKKIIEIKEEEDGDDNDNIFDNEDKDLNDLCNFCIDFRELKERTINQCNLEPKLFNSNFSGSIFQEQNRDSEIDKQVNYIMKNQLYKNLIRNKIYKNKKPKKAEYNKNYTIDSYSAEKTTQINSSIADIDNMFRKTNSLNNFSSINLVNAKKFNNKLFGGQEIILFKQSNNKYQKKIRKLILVNNYIFYYVTFNQINFVYKKIIPLKNLYIRKKKLNNLMYIIIISQAHNKTIKKEFYSKNYDIVNKFISKFNNNTYYRDITKYYYFKYEIDKGKFGHVFLARRNHDDKKLAIKLIPKKNRHLEEYKINRWEKDIFSSLQNINHPNIVRCYDIFENDSQIFFVYEYLSFGNLKKYMQELKFYPTNFNTQTILSLIFQLIDGIYILHKFGIIHRDIKTTNLMVEINSPAKKSIISNSFGTSELQITYEDISNVNMKIIDFGLSRVLGINEKANEPYGSLSFKAPELILNEEYDFKVDIWALGITLYYIIYKALPFEGSTRDEIKKGIINNPIIFYENDILINASYYDGYINDNDKDSKEFQSAIIYSILKDCLIKNPKERFNIDDLYNKYYEIIKAF